MVGSVNRRCRLTLETFRNAVDTALAKQCEIFVVAGDLFDTCKPEPPIIADVLETIAGASDRMLFYLMVGNHDQNSLTLGDNALAPLFPHARIVEGPMRQARGEDVELLFVPFRPGNAREWLPKAVRDIATDIQGKRRILFLHVGIIGANTPPWLREAHGAVHVDDLRSLCEDLHIERVFAGDWHDHHDWKGDGQPGGFPRITQIGTLCPTGFDNPGLEGYGRLAICDVYKMKNEYIEIPGPRFVKVDFSTGGDPLLATEKGNTVFCSRIVHPNEAKAALESMNLSIAAGDIAGGEIVVDKSSIEQAAGKAARAATQAGSLSEALAGYVEKMPLDDGIDRAEVLTRSRRYLKVS